MVEGKTDKHCYYYHHYLYSTNLSKDVMFLH